ncbi:MAG TPA: hypothetical protein VMV31_05875 [Terriglobales bacterium]|nr:hypothetical protein [Terriglobales bacterium]
MSRESQLLLAMLFVGVTGAGAQAPAGAALKPGTIIKIELQKKLDTKKAKVGDAVVAKVMQPIKDHQTVLVPKDSLLVGQVTLATPAKGKTHAQLGVLFDEATTKQGTVLLHLRGAIVKVRQDSTNWNEKMSIPPEMGGSGIPMAMSPTNDDAAYPNLDKSSDGAPIEYAVMETADGTGADLGGVISSVGGNFDLDGGTHLQVRVLH